MVALTAGNNTQTCNNSRTHGVVMKHELHGLELDELAHAAVADAEVAEQLQRLVDDRLAAAPVLQVRDAASTASTYSHATSAHEIGTLLGILIQISFLFN